MMSISTDEEGAIDRQRELNTLMAKVMEEVEEKHSKGTLRLQTLAQSFLDLNIPSWLDNDELLLKSSPDTIYSMARHGVHMLCSLKDILQELDDHDVEGKHEMYISRLVGEAVAMKLMRPGVNIRSWFPIVYYCWDELLIRPCDRDRVLDVVYHKLKHAVDTWDPSQDSVSSEEPFNQDIDVIPIFNRVKLWELLFLPEKQHLMDQLYAPIQSISESYNRAE